MYNVPKIQQWQYYGARMSYAKIHELLWVYVKFEGIYISQLVLFLKKESFKILETLA